MSTSEQSRLDAFTYNGGPTLYANTNRTPAVEDVRNILIYVTFATLFVAFLIIIPGIRKERFSTFICVTMSLFVGGVILVANFGTSWHVASASISSPYRAFSKEKLFADVGVRVGLQSVNITLRANKQMHPEPGDINFNERFYWIGPTEMKQEYHNALAKGLPFPILTIAEYLSQDGEGFCWGRRYRAAGYYVSLLLWASFASWLLMNLLLCAVPRYGVYTMQITGALMLCSNAMYAILLPRKPLVIPFEGESLTFAYGWCFWLVMVAGVTSILVGAAVTIIDTLFPNKFSTILEVDYDTPYRYFVGNDAHLFGAEGLANADKGGHGHTCSQHKVASATSSTITEATTCCASSSTEKATLSKTKSDASTLTTQSIPVTNRSEHHQRGDKSNQSSSGASARLTDSDRTVTSTTLTTTVDLESTTDPDGSVAGDTRPGASPGGPGGDGSGTGRLQGGVENRAFERDVDSDGSDVSTTIIDGKRAISLHNFGKFASAQQRRQDRTTTTTTATSVATASNGLQRDASHFKY